MQKLWHSGKLISHKIWRCVVVCHCICKWRFAKNTPLLTWNLGIPSKCPCRWKALDRWPKGLVLNLKMNYARGWLARRCCNKSWTVRGEFCYMRRCSRSSFLPGEGFWVLNHEVHLPKLVPSNMRRPFEWSKHRGHGPAWSSTQFLTSQSRCRAHPHARACQNEQFRKAYTREHTHAKCRT